MDAIVEAAMRKWPAVPACHGWLALDARGDWYMRDAATQARGAFPQVKGSRIEHAKLKQFIGRNYMSDAHGCWYFQNGPQRVYVQLEVAPWVLGLAWQQGAMALITHTGDTLHEVRSACLDECGRVFIATELGLGLIRSTDMYAVSEAVEAQVLLLEECRYADLLQRHRVVLDPAAQSCR